MPPPDQKLVVGIANLIERINEATNGQVKITPYSGGALVPPPEIFKSVKGGIIEMGHTITGYHVGFMPFCAVLDGLPLSWKEPPDIVECMWERGLEDLIREEYAKQGVHFLTWGISGPISILSTKPLRTKADFQGTKIRGWGAWNPFFAKLGASPVDMPLMEAYTALAMGTVDAAITGITAHYDLKHYEVAKYGMVPYLIGDAVQDITVNLDTWNALPEDLRSSIQSAAVDFTKWSTTYYYETYDLAAHDKLTDVGVEWVEVDAETQSWMREKAMELWDAVAAKDPVAARAMKIMTDYLR